MIQEGEEIDESCVSAVSNFTEQLIIDFCFPSWGLILSSRRLYVANSTSWDKQYPAQMIKIQETNVCRMLYNSLFLIAHCHQLDSGGNVLYGTNNTFRIQYTVHSINFVLNRTWWRCRLNIRAGWASHGYTLGCYSTVPSQTKKQRKGWMYGYQGTQLAHQRSKCQTLLRKNRPLFCRVFAQNLSTRHCGTQYSYWEAFAILLSL